MASSQSNEFFIRHTTLKDVVTYRDILPEALKNHLEAFGQDYIEDMTKYLQAMRAIIHTIISKENYYVS
jgi:hypothetical protein